MNIVKFITSNKTYVIAGTIGILGVLQGLDVLVLPESCWIVLSAFGLGFLRSGVQKVSDAVEDINETRNDNNLVTGSDRAVQG